MEASPSVSTDLLLDEVSEDSAIESMGSASPFQVRGHLVSLSLHLNLQILILWSLLLFTCTKMTPNSFNVFRPSKMVGARCSSVVRAFAHGAMGRRIDPSWGEPIELFLVPASAPRLV